LFCKIAKRTNNMMRLLTSTSCLVGLLAVAVQAFVPQRPPAFHRVVEPSSLSQNSPRVPAATCSPSSSSSSALAMGIVEDFVTSTDQKSRQATNEKYLAELQKRVDKINALEATIEELDDEQLQAKTQEFKQRLAAAEGGEDVNGPLLEEAFAVVREAAW
jgi:SecA DEAD-like domain